MSTPRTSSELIESPAPATRSDAPKGDLVMVAGPAAKGPTEPVTVEEEDDLYRLFGKEGPLADAAAAVLAGASVGTQLSENNRYGRVRVLRTETGSPASVDLHDVDDQLVMTLETGSSGRNVNDYWVERAGNEFMINDPEATEEDRIKSFSVDPGATSDAAIGTPSDLADALQEEFGRRLEIDQETYDAHFEISTDKVSGEIAIDSGEKTTRLDFSGSDATDMNNIQPGASTVIGGETNYFDNPSTAANAQNRILSEEAAEARFYAITGGNALTIPEGRKRAEINRLADSNQISAGTNTLLNVRTSGGNGAVTIAEAGQNPNTDVVSEGWFKVRRHETGRLDLNNTVAADAGLKSYTVEAAADVDPSGDIGSSNSSDLTYDGYNVTSGDKVLIFGQGTGTKKDGIYNVATDDTDTTQYLEPTRSSTATTISGEIVEVLNGSDVDNSGVKTYSDKSYELTDAEMVQVKVDAPAGVATSNYSGANTVISTLVDDYLATLTGGYQASDIADERLGEHFDYGQAIKLEAAPAVDADAIEDLNLKFNSNGTTDGIQADASWANGTLTIEFSKADYKDQHGSTLDDGYLYTSFDSCLTPLTEKSSEPQLNTATDSLEYTVEDFQLTLNQDLDHDLVVRPLMVNQYRLGNALTVNRTDTGSNEFVISGKGAQPGEGGGPIGEMETILGFDYGFEPDFPTIPDRADFTGGSAGLNEDAATKAEALRDALEDYADEDYDAIYPAGLYVDDTKSSRDPVTGAKSEKPVDTVSILQEHQERLDARGSSGLVYMDVEPMEASTSTGRYSISRKRERFAELVGTGGSGEVTAGSIIQAESRPEFFFFDAPAVMRLGGRTVSAPGAAFFAGLRSTTVNDKALYEIDLPNAQVRPLYKYDGAEEDMTRALGDARINAWNIGRNKVRLASDVTGAGLITSPSGELVESSYKTGIAVVISKEFQREAERELENQIGPMDGSGSDHLRNVIVTQLNGVQQRIRGALDLRIDPQKNIKIDSEGGSSVGVRIRCDVQVPGEILSIDLDVGSYSQIGQQARSQDESTATIPQSR